MGMSEIQWQKSSYSTDAEGNCVELAAQAVGTVLLRESDAPGVPVTTTPAHLRTLLRHVKAGRLGGAPRP
ncbi:DUF397 domain-containing protein [Streptomyces sp. NPDC050610]|uniref:DUF397 domain-containing protein n=1 Tax=Streptomyces sp. NPDC050610 TaxID=3157097 RepID=UPI00342BE711